MLFTSIDFVIFLPVVFLLYWFAANGSLKLQNLLLLASSYFFYACWDWRFLFLLVFSTFLDYFTGLKMAGAKNRAIKKSWFWLSISVNLGLLGVFKYYNFFASSFVAAAAHLGVHINYWTLKVIMPVGISFYTFHGISYVIDIYNDKIKAEKNFIFYSVFVCFFPLLIAGPIERASHLLPQIQQKRNFDYSKGVDGLRQILWGVFKKVVIADQCAEYANMIFNNAATYSGCTLFLGAIFFTFQIYGDFSGYSDIAIGTAKLFGIDLIRNFAFPYFSRDIAEFWRRWHISLSTWFRDYLYIPLGGSKGGRWMKVRNTFIIFIVSGFWHGANWTFLAWGALNAIYLLPLLLTNSNRNNLNIVAQGRWFPSVKQLFQMVMTFGFTMLAWIFFRSDSICEAFQYISRIFVHPGSFLLWKVYEPYGTLIVLLIVFIIIEWIGREGAHPLAHFGKRRKKLLHYIVYYLIILAIFWYSGKEQQFIYFQF